MGPVAISVLKDLRGAQPPEAQQRIDSVVKELEKQRDKNPSATSGPKPTPSPAPANLELQIDQ
jgi:hypothetical protein